MKTLLFCFYQFSIDFITRFVVSFLLFLILFSPIPVGVGRFFVCRHCAALRYKRQYRTKSVWRLCTPSACKFTVIFHKNAREYIKYSLRFLFHLTKNLTTHLSHNLCAVLPKQKCLRRIVFAGVFSGISRTLIRFPQLFNGVFFQP